MRLFTFGKIGAGVALILVSAFAMATEKEDTQTEGQRCLKCMNERIRTQVLSASGIRLFEILAPECSPPKRYFMATKNERGLLLVHTMELIKVREQQAELKKYLRENESKIHISEADEKRRHIREYDEKIKKITSDIEYYSRQLTQEENLPFYQMSKWKVSPRETYAEYGQRINAHIEAGKDYQYVCGFTQEVRSR